ncbi:MAG: alcohol dehydrogenase catalytic domain-containing protein [Leptospiraceae bacterium]|nr:alcohol dehydrogenase catalytic domain-containing protein [Leptospiraceae bacterium]MCP5499864.1 alcohol dehydrogenase catalytic domain-containing protein [Leptospiraceae bacterium]
MEVQFSAQEYTSDDRFITSQYLFKGSVDSQWEIFRNGSLYLRLGKGYELLKTKICGICATDLSRRFLPFPLPQIIGHELLATHPKNGKVYAVEINDTSLARGEGPYDSFIRSGLATHSPERMVLGIDRLPGGFGPYVLVPKNAMVEIGDLNPYTAVLLEPFAAALQALYANPPKDNMVLAVLGPRRLGTLVIAALDMYRNITGSKYNIVALSRHDALLNLSKNVGADEGINLLHLDVESLKDKYNIVYDTSGSPDGFELAVKMAKDEVHLKSTNGQEMLGLKHLTELVVDEMSLLPYSESGLNFHWEEESVNERIYLAPGVQNFLELKAKKVYSTSISGAESILDETEFADRLPRFDLGIASSLEEIDKLIRPSKKHENSLIRPRGAILFKGEAGTNPLLQFLQSGGRLRTSRCGDFHKALDLLKKNPETVESLSRYMISDKYRADQLNEAFKKARSKEAIKVVLEHFL